MVGEVNRLAENLLLTERMLRLPAIGTLRVERVAARRLSKRSIVPPHRVVTFSSQEEGEPFPDAIARAAGCAREQALAVYERWRSYVLADGVLTIEGVGVLRQKHFSPDPAFDGRLNPQGYAPMRLRPVRRFDWAVWFGIVAILLALGFGGYQFLQMQPDIDRVRPDVTQTLVGNDAEVEPADALSEAVVPEPSIGGGEPAVPEKKSAVSAEPHGSPSTDNASANQAPAPNGQARTVVDGRSESASAAPGAIRPTAGTAEEPSRLVSGRNYVVFGVFSTPENAGRAVQAAEKRTPGIRCSVYVFGEKWMVSPFEAEDALSCSQFVNEYNDRFPGIWVYKAR